MQALSAIAHQSLNEIRQIPKASAIARASESPPVAATDKEKLSNHLFRYMMGRYGAQKFLKEYTSGRIYTEDELPPGDPRVGQDRGVCTARSVWGESLIKYSMDTIKMALERLKSSNPTWPPTLGEFELLCESCVIRDPVRPLTDVERAQLDARMAVDRERRQALQAMRQERQQLQRQALRGNVKASRALLPQEHNSSPLERLQEALAAALAAQGVDEGQALRMAGEKITPEIIASWASGDWRGL